MDNLLYSIAAIVFCIMAFPVFVLCIVWVGRWILGPIDRAAKARKGSVRFSVADFLCLFIVIQIPLAAAYQFSDEETAPYYWLLTGLTWIVAPLIWVATTHALSKAGVTVGIHRLAFTGLVVPLAYYGLVPFVVMAIMGVGLIGSGRGQLVAQNEWLVAIWLILGISFYISGLYTRWMMRPTALHNRVDHKEDDEKTE